MSRREMPTVFHPMWPSGRHFALAVQRFPHSRGFSDSANVAPFAPDPQPQIAGSSTIQLRAVIAPLGPFQVAIRPREPRLEVPAFDLAKPTDAPQIIAAPPGLHHPGFGPAFEMTAIQPVLPQVHAVVPPAVTAKMVEMKEHFDIEIRHGVLTLRREITNEDPASLASWIDMAADGARVVVKQAAAGYR